MLYANDIFILELVFFIFRRHRLPSYIGEIEQKVFKNSCMNKTKCTFYYNDYGNGERQVEKLNYERLYACEWKIS